MASIPSEERRHVEHDVAQVINRFYIAFDDNDLETMLRLVTPDWTWFRQGGDVDGHDSLRALVETRPPAPAAHHMVANLIVGDLTADRAVAWFYLANFPAKAPDAAAAPPPRWSGVRRALLLRTTEGWVIRDMRGEDRVRLPSTVDEAI